MDRPSSQLLGRAATAAALAGFLFGFDTAVISGADQPIQALWNTSPLFHGTFIMSMALWGTVLGALLGNRPCDHFGRKKTLIGIGVLYLVSAVGSALAPDPYSFSFFRFIGGVGVGASSIAAPAYIAEIAPAARRGRLVILYQFMIVLGILVAFLSNWLVGTSSIVHAWRWMLGIEALPALLYTLLVLRIPESPRWLVLFGKQREAAQAVLGRLQPELDATVAVAAIEARAAATPPSNGTSTAVWLRPPYRFVLILAALMAFFNQFSGINFVIYYAPRLFASAGLAESTALLSSVGVGLVNLFFTMIGVLLIDRVGRRKLMYYGSVGYISTLLVVAWAFHTGAGGVVVILFVFAFIAAHAIGQGSVVWVFISEIIPTPLRAAGQSIATGVLWVSAALITLFTLFFMDLLGDRPAPLFLFFAFMMVLQLGFVHFMMPETKGKSLEELEDEIERQAR